MWLVLKAASVPHSEDWLMSLPIAVPLLQIIEVTTMAAFSIKTAPYLTRSVCKRTILRSLNRIIGPQTLRLNPLDYHVWDAILETNHRLQLKHKMTDELKVILQISWKELPQEHIDKAVANFNK